MKLLLYYIIGSIFLSLSVGCTKDIRIKLDEKPRHLVIEGNVYDKPGPYYVRVTWSNTGLLNPAYNGGPDKAEPVKGALVIISDNLGNTDTLKPSPDSTTSYAKYYNNRSSPYDSVLMTRANPFNGKSGFYETSILRGVSGSTYHLRVIYDNNEYNADAYMTTVPVIDSVQFKTRYNIKGDLYTTPLIFFLEPQQEINYYWTFIDGAVDVNTSIPYQHTTGIQDLPFSIFNDKFLQPYVNGLFSDHTYRKDASYSSIVSTYGTICLGSLTKEHYNFLKILVDQLQNDGGTFKPTPASPQSNISNGALGFFGASAISRYFVFAPDFP